MTGVSMLSSFSFLKTWFLGIEVWSSCLQGMHYTKWVTFPDRFADLLLNEHLQAGGVWQLKYLFWAILFKKYRVKMSCESMDVIWEKSKPLFWCNPHKTSKICKNHLYMVSFGVIETYSNPLWIYINIAENKCMHINIGS